MKKINQRWITRGGRVAVITSVTAEDFAGYPIQARIVGNLHALHYTEDGEFIAGKHSQNDLMREEGKPK